MTRPLDLANPQRFWDYVRNLYGSYSRDPISLVTDGARVLAIYRALYLDGSTDAQVDKALADLDALARGEA